jgi:secreted Zn-dependent insulinase-like peptidase
MTYPLTGRGWRIFWSTCCSSAPRLFRGARPDGLCAAHGGQVNARTSERHTDFFFELPPGAFAGGLERLCDMLTHPRLDPDDQLREREVLHAEFIAWAREPSAQRECKGFKALNATHPLRGFHAGNRYSLPVPHAAFQQALTHFHEAVLSTGQMTLSLVPARNRSRSC